MKRISVLCFMLVALFMSSKLVAQDKKVALVTFYCDKKIGGTGMGTIGESLINDPDFNLQPVIEKAYTTFITDFAKDFPFKMVDKAVVTGNEAYKNYKSTILWDTTKGFNKIAGLQYAVANGFIFAYPGGPVLKASNRDEMNLYSILKNDCDGVMLVNIDYEITPGFGGLYANVTAFLTMSLWDKDGNKVFRIREYSKSSKKVAAVAGIPVMKSDKIQPLCEDATNVLFEELKDKLAKIVKKSAKF